MIVNKGSFPLIFWLIIDVFVSSRYIGYYMWCEDMNFIFEWLKTNYFMNERSE